MSGRLQAGATGGMRRCAALRAAGGRRQVLGRPQPWRLSSRTDRLPTQPLGSLEPRRSLHRRPQRRKMSRGRAGLIKAVKEVRGAERTSHQRCVGAGRRRLCCRRSPPPALAAAALPTARTTRPQVFREVKFFGDAEIATLKKELESHKVQLEQLKQVRGCRPDRGRRSAGGRPGQQGAGHAAALSAAAARAPAGQQ